MTVPMPMTTGFFQPRNHAPNVPWAIPVALDVALSGGVLSLVSPAIRMPTSNFVLMPVLVGVSCFKLTS